MVKRIFGLIISVIGLLWFIAIIASFSHVVQTTTANVNSGYRFGTILSLILAIVCMVIGVKWFRRKERP